MSLGIDDLLNNVAKKMVASKKGYKQTYFNLVDDSD